MPFCYNGAFCSGLLKKYFCSMRGKHSGKYWFWPFYLGGQNFGHFCIGGIKFWQFLYEAVCKKIVFFTEGGWKRLYGGRNEKKCILSLKNAILLYEWGPLGVQLWYSPTYTKLVFFFKLKYRIWKTIPYMKINVSLWKVGLNGIVINRWRSTESNPSLW